MNQFIGASVFNNRFPTNPFRPIANFANRLPLVYNPNFFSNNIPLATFDPCTTLNNEAGVCVPGTICSVLGGKPGGTCKLNGVCCVSKLNFVNLIEQSN